MPPATSTCFDRIISCVILALILSASGIAFVSPTARADPIIAATPVPETTFVLPLPTLEAVQVNASDSSTDDPNPGWKLLYHPPTPDLFSGAATWYTYDTFGRLRKIIKPGDSETYPTVEYQYVDAYTGNGLTGLKVLELDREISGNGSASRSIMRFYTGLGQLVQTRAETVDDSQQSVTNVEYDARGQVKDQYAPVAMGFSSDFTPICCSDAAKTETQYDALGRATVITATDGTPAEHRHSLAVDNGPTLQVENVIDANRHRRDANGCCIHGSTQ